jgi:hypothetical protein
VLKLLEAQMGTKRPYLSPGTLTAPFGGSTGYFNL